MKKKIFVLLPVIFICISTILIYQTRSNRNEQSETIESSVPTEKSAFEQLQIALGKELTDLGEALISFVHFEDRNLATITTDNEFLSLPIEITDSDTNEFRLRTVVSSPDNLLVGSTLGLAADETNTYYYYLLK